MKNHPFFWQSKKRLEFFQLVSDRLQEERREPGSTSLLTFLERGASKIVSDNWLAKLGIDEFSKTLHKPPKGRKKYDSTRLEALLRLIRNTAHHLGDLDSAAQNCIGKSSPEVLFYFTDKFPRLLMHVYCVIGETRNREVEVWEELDLRNFYISFATAIPIRPQEQQEEDVEDPKEGNWFLWIAGSCVVVSWVLNALSLTGVWELKEGLTITVFFISHAVVILQMCMARLIGRSPNVKAY